VTVGVAHPLAAAVTSDLAVERLAVGAYEIPTDGPDGKEADGTLEWDATTIVVVEAHAGGEAGIGYTYGESAVAALVEQKLGPDVVGSDPLAIGETWARLTSSLRNAGRPGVGFMAVSAIDVALWDLKARLLGLPLVDLLDRFHEGTAIYGSGGFCNYPRERLREQLLGWVEQGIPRVKLKVSRHPEEDAARLDAVREAIGDEPELYVDSNGALSRKQALAWAERFASRWGVRWFEEPVSSADLEGLRLLRDRGPGGLDIAAGEYAFVPRDFVNLLEAGAVDCLQADVTRCGGITGFLRASALADAAGLDLSGHCAPNVTAHAMTGVLRVRHLEYFHDHVRVERLLFDGVLDPEGGRLVPDRTRPGLGLEPRWQDVEDRCVYRGEVTG
jgi:L-alanine-DL-glutamate epimerase-like enolase superfamily enzyme